MHLSNWVKYMELDHRNHLSPGIVQFENVQLGDYFYTGKVDITETHIVNFAGISGDFFDVHMDEEFAKSHGFSSRLAHGLLIMSIVDGLKNRAGVAFESIASLGWENWDFLAPVCAGDAISAKVMIIDKRETSKRGLGIIKLLFEVYNQNQIMVQTGKNNLLVTC